MMARVRLCDRHHACVRCGDCCHGLVCGYAMEERFKKMNTSNLGPCEYLDSQEDGTMLCGLYRMSISNGKMVRAGVMARHLHFGKGCTSHRNRRRQALLCQDKVST